MNKFGFLAGMICLGWTTLCSAQMFWSFDDSQNPLPIPAECDAKFDEIRGGVFMPTEDEMYEYGMDFLGNPSLSVKRQGAYCLIGAALQGHPDAQLEVAKLYENGQILPQDDLSAYKWSFIAALNGNKSAEKLTLLLEQFLTTQDLEKTTAAIQATRMQIQENLQRKIEEERQQVQKERAELEQLTNELKGGKSANPSPSQENEGPSPESLLQPNHDLNAIFVESDRMQ